MWKKMVNIISFFKEKDKEGFFRIGISIGDSQGFPFKPEPNYLKGTHSIDPCMFPDTDGKYYLIFGGLQGGQLDQYIDNKWNADNKEPKGSEPAKMPKIGLMKYNMLELVEEQRDLITVNEKGNYITSEDSKRRFFEACLDF